MKRLILIITLLITLIIPSTLSMSCDSPKLPEITVWTNGDIVGQGYLVDANCTSSDYETRWLITLELMLPDTQEWEHTIYSLVGELEVSNFGSGGHAIGFFTFNIGAYYILYQKWDTETESYRYMLSELPNISDEGTISNAETDETLWIAVETNREETTRRGLGWEELGLSSNCPSIYPLSEEECLAIGGHYYEVSYMVYMSDPPQYTRICRLCGHTEWTFSRDEWLEWIEEDKELWED